MINTTDKNITIYIERVVNVWNCLIGEVDLTTAHSFKRTIKHVHLIIINHFLKSYIDIFIKYTGYFCFATVRVYMFVTILCFVFVFFQGFLMSAASAR